MMIMGLLCLVSANDGGSQSKPVAETPKLDSTAKAAASRFRPSFFAPSRSFGFWQDFLSAGFVSRNWPQAGKQENDGGEARSAFASQESDELVALRAQIATLQQEKKTETEKHAQALREAQEATERQKQEAITSFKELAALRAAEQFHKIELAVTKARTEELSTLMRNRDREIAEANQKIGGLQQSATASLRIMEAMAEGRESPETISGMLKAFSGILSEQERKCLAHLEERLVVLDRKKKEAETAIEEIKQIAGSEKERLLAEKRREISKIEQQMEEVRAEKKQQEEEAKKTQLRVVELRKKLDESSFYNAVFMRTVNRTTNSAQMVCLVYQYITEAAGRTSNPTEAMKRLNPYQGDLHRRTNPFLDMIHTHDPQEQQLKEQVSTAVFQLLHNAGALNQLVAFLRAGTNKVATTLTSELVERAISGEEIVRSGGPGDAMLSTGYASLRAA